MYKISKKLITKKEVPCLSYQTIHSQPPYTDLLLFIPLLLTSWLVLVLFSELELEFLTQWSQQHYHPVLTRKKTP